MIGKFDLAGVSVSQLALGTVPMNPKRYDEQAAVMDRFLELGGKAIDMAWVYYGGKSTECVGRWLKERGCRDQVVLMTKVCHPFGVEANRFSPKNLRSDVEAELERAQVDHFEFAAFHRDNPKQELAPMLETLAAMKAEGKIGGWGASNWSLERIEEFNALAAQNGEPGFAFNNPQLFLGEVNEPMWGGCVTLDRAGVAWHEKSGMPLVSWSSAGGGFYAGVDSDDVRRVYHSEANFARRDRAAQLAEQKGCTVLQIALAYVLNQAFPTMAVIGPDRVDHLEENAAACSIELTADERVWLLQGG